MKFYRLNYFTSNRLENYLGFTVDFNQLVGVDNYLFNTTPLSESIDLSNLSAQFHLDKSVKKFKYDFFKSSDNIIIGSLEFCEIIKSYESDFTFIPIKGFYANKNRIEKEFYIIHIGYELDCFDYYNSEYYGKTISLKRLQQGKKPHLIKTIQKLQLTKTNNHFFFVDNIIHFEPIITHDLAFRIKHLCLEIKEFQYNES